MEKLDYYKIGQRIRKFRKANGLSQEQLAERVGISTTHLSHIETGNTKLSLPVFIDISHVLSVQTDQLLYDAPQNQVLARNEILDILDSCSVQETYILKDIIKSTIVALNKYTKKP